MKPATLGLLLPLLLCACQRDPAPVPPQAALPAPAPDAAPVATPPAPNPAPAAEVASAPPPSFSCRGNEPFWALEIGAGGTAVLRTPESETVLAGSAVASAGGAYAFQGQPEAADGAPVSALLAPAQCFDSMADGPAMPFSVQVGLPDGQVGSGCCSVVEDSDAEGTTESPSGP